LQLRDLNLARAEEETCREIVKRMPLSEQLIVELATRAREYEMNAEVPRQGLTSDAEGLSARRQGLYPAILDPAAKRWRLPTAGALRNSLQWLISLPTCRLRCWLRRVN
jgi:hypothetical protein